MDEIIIYISGIEDRRQEWKVAHQLVDIVVIVLFATLANADDWHEIEIFARNNEEVSQPLMRCPVLHAVALKRSWQKSAWT